MKRSILPGLLGGAAAGLAAAWLLLSLGGGSPAPAERYTLGEYGGRVAVYAPERGRIPRQVTAIEVGLLPATDRAQLREGIPVRDRRELAVLLEDLGS